VESYRLSPFDPDDPAHPSVYNALWRALDRLDSKAARDLIAPQAGSSDKIGTTASGRLAQQICGRVSRALTRDEWGRFLPKDAPYTTPWASPCSGVPK